MATHWRSLLGPEDRNFLHYFWSTFTRHLSKWMQIIILFECLLNTNLTVFLFYYCYVMMVLFKLEQLIKIVLGIQHSLSIGSKQKNNFNNKYRHWEHNWLNSSQAVSQLSSIIYTVESRYLEFYETIFYKFKLPKVQINLHFG